MLCESTERSTVSSPMRHAAASSTRCPTQITPPAEYGPTHHAWQCHESASARARVRLEHVFATEKRPTGSMVRTIGLAQAMAKITLANLTCDTRGLVWTDGRTAPAWPAYSEEVNRISGSARRQRSRAGQCTPRNGNTASITAHRNRLLEISDRRTFGRLRHFSRIASTAMESRPAFRRSAPHPSPATGNAPKPRQRI